MGDPRNPARATELWNPVRYQVLLDEVTALRDVCTLSGGWAWHFMSPPHEELKVHHDHRDIDLFVKPPELPTAIQRLTERGYRHVWSRFDARSKDKFYRYEKRVETSESVKVIIDLFVEDIASIERNGFKLVEPKTLLSLYKRVHSTNDCTAVQNARRLIEKGIDPVGRPEMVTPWH
jgi:hypothetical protein